LHRGAGAGVRAYAADRDAFVFELRHRSERLAGEGAAGGGAGAVPPSGPGSRRRDAGGSRGGSLCPRDGVPLRSPERPRERAHLPGSEQREHRVQAALAAGRRRGDRAGADGDGKAGERPAAGRFRAGRGQPRGDDGGASARRAHVLTMLRRLGQGAVIVAALALLAFAWHCDEAWFDKHVFLPQQFFIPASRGIVFWARTMAATTAALLLLLVPRLPHGASARRLLVALLLTLPAAEGLLRWRTRRLIRPELLAAMDALTASHPRYGFTLAAAIDRVQPMSGRAIRFRTDSKGRRIPGAPIDPALPSLVFTGESTVAGFGLQWEETFPALLGERFHLQVVNLGSPAYRADQSWLRLEDALPELDHPVAVIAVFMPGLVGRSFAGQRHPRARPSPSSGVE